MVRGYLDITKYDEIFEDLRRELGNSFMNYYVNYPTHILEGVVYYLFDKYVENFETTYLLGRYIVSKVIPVYLREKVYNLLGVNIGRALSRNIEGFLRDMYIKGIKTVMYGSVMKNTIYVAEITIRKIPKEELIREFIDSLMMIKEYSNLSVLKIKRLISLVSIANTYGYLIGYKIKITKPISSIYNFLYRTMHGNDYAEEEDDVTEYFKEKINEGYRELDILEYWKGYYTHIRNLILRNYMSGDFIDVENIETFFKDIKHLLPNHIHIFVSYVYRILDITKKPISPLVKLRLIDREFYNEVLREYYMKFVKPSIESIKNLNVNITERWLKTVEKKIERSFSNYGGRL